MPELRSSARQARLRSKKLDDLQPGEPPAKPVPPAPQRAAKRAPTRAARGRKGAAGRGAPPAPNPRRKGVEIADLEADPACEDPPKAAKGLEVAAVAAPKNLPSKKVPEVGVPKMDGESAEKIVGAEDESTATPVPERVLLALLHFFVHMDCHLPSLFPSLFYLFAAHLITQTQYFFLALRKHTGFY